MKLRSAAVSVASGAVPAEGGYDNEGEKEEHDTMGGLQRVRVELARDHDFPDGSNQHGYEFVLPLDAESRFDTSRWRRDATVCTVRRI
jgi:hypothetical protein